MLRNLQGSVNSVDAQYKITVGAKRGIFVNKVHASKTAILPTNADEVYMVERGIVIDPVVAAFGVTSDYDTLQETVVANEFVGLVTPVKGGRWATSEYAGADADLAADKYLKVETTVGADQGKLVTSATPTKFKSLGYFMDNGHKLLAYEVLA